MDTRHCLFFRMRRSIDESMNSRYVTGSRVELVLKRMLSPCSAPPCPLFLVSLLHAVLHIPALAWKPGFDDLELVLKQWVEGMKPQGVILSDALIGCTIFLVSDARG
ncbi:hypothetical protein JB92DRAFT_421276 [Gautieria morchelliformis]|nr:hypothetical protein JB92DRAFT_421276 [Gautieria morchelliformis]